MTRITQTPQKAILWLAALTLLLAVPATASAEDCVTDYTQCIMEKGMSTECLHDYLGCVRETIRWY